MEKLTMLISIFVLILAGFFITEAMINNIDSKERMNNINNMIITHEKAEISDIKDIYSSTSNTKYSITTVYPILITGKQIYPSETFVKTNEPVKLIVNTDIMCDFNLNGYNIKKRLYKGVYEIEFKATISDKLFITCKNDRLELSSKVYFVK